MNFDIDQLRGRKVTIIEAPLVIPMAEMRLIPAGLEEAQEWIKQYHPECGEEFDLFSPSSSGREPSDNEKSCEIAGRMCYFSFGEAAGKKYNDDYLENIASIRHLSVLYHAKFSFSIFGISRRVGEELLRHYVGADRDSEGSPSKESTRYTLHPGFFVAQPGDLESKEDRADFERDCQNIYDQYIARVISKVERYKTANEGREPKGMARKRILENAAGRLGLQAACSVYWTCNAVSLAKMINERTSEAADLEFQRLAIHWRGRALSMAPGLLKPLING